MTPVGQSVFGMYSFVTIIILVIFNIRKIAKEDTRGWELVVLIPVLIFLANII